VNNYRGYANIFALQAEGGPCEIRFSLQAEYPVDRLERMSKILTPYGGTEKNLDS
jgi:hypothetical protein